jgi:hypothetical protein
VGSGGSVASSMAGQQRCRCGTCQQFEKEVLLLGWSSTGGLWLVRLENRTAPWEGSNLTKLVSTMDERCEALKQSRATFYKDPKGCDYVKSLLDGFGEHEEEDNTPMSKCRLAGTRSKCKVLIISQIVAASSSISQCRESELYFFYKNNVQHVSLPLIK